MHIRRLKDEVENLKAVIKSLYAKVDAITSNSESATKGETNLGSTMPSVGQLRGTFNNAKQNRSI